MSRSPALALLAISVALPLSTAAHAQDHAGHHGQPAAQSTPEDEHSGHEGHAPTKPVSSEPADPHAGHVMDSAQPTPSRDAAADAVHGDHSGHAMQREVQPAAAGHQHGAASTSVPSTPIPEVSDADRAAAFPVLHKHMEHAPEFNWFVGVNRLEAWDAEEGTGQGWEASAWFGTDLNRLWLRTEGERVGGHTEAADIEVLYGRSVSAWWDVVGGVRHETRPGPSRSWAAFGVQGLAPYKFEVQATAYVGDGGRVEANVEAEYELLLTNRLILQPLVEVDLAAKDDLERGIGRGVSKAEAGLRLRYEFTRKFAPYVGLVHERSFGRTADLREAEGEHVSDTRFVVGLRTWF